MNTNYLLITPIKNEEKNLGKLIDSVVSQTIHPVLWVIINDHSTDSSADYILKAESEHDWIKGFTPDIVRGNRDLGFHLPKIMQMGVDFAYNLCKSANLDLDYVGNIDGDIYLATNYFEALIQEFSDNPKLGVASGYPHIESKGEFVPASSSDLPSGGVLLIKKECFDAIGGIPQSYSYDSVLNVKARFAGFDLKRFKSAKHFSTRYAQGADGNWKRYVTLGKSHYYIGYGLFLVFFRSIKYMFNNGVVQGVGYFYGYIESLIKRTNKIPDMEVRNYFRHAKFKEIFMRYNN